MQGPPSSRRPLSAQASVQALQVLSQALQVRGPPSSRRPLSAQTSAQALQVIPQALPVRGPPSSRRPLSAQTRGPPSCPLAWQAQACCLV